MDHQLKPAVEKEKTKKPVTRKAPNSDSSLLRAISL
jgi:hypothetical protein